MASSQEVKGSCEDKFLPVKDAFSEAFDRGDCFGASLCVYLRNEKVIDLYSGLKLPLRLDEPWEEDTLVNVYSVTKAWTALCIHILKERGHLSYDDPVVKHWPEFGQNGKDQITIRQTLSHQSGLQTLDVPVYTFEKLTNWNYIISLIQRMVPLWKPGSRAAYHAFTYGHINGEIVRRCDPKGRSVGQFFRDEVAKPLGLEDELILGFTEDQMSELRKKCAKVFDGNEYERYLFQGTESEFNKEISNLLGETETEESRIKALSRATELNPQRPCKFANIWQKHELPASGGHATARALAKLFAVLLDDKRKSNTLLASSTLDEVTEHVWATTEYSKMGGGFALQLLGAKKAPRCFGHSGLGGHLVFADPDKEISFAFTTNKLLNFTEKSPCYMLAHQTYGCLIEHEGKL